MNFLKNLDYLLKKNHLSRSDLGRAINIPPSTINSWFNRSSDGVALKTLVSIANFFNVSLDTLVNSENIEKETQKEEPFTAQEIRKIKRMIKYYDFAERINDD